MNNRFRKGLALLLAFALAVALVPASVLTAQAAEATPEGYVLFNENFDSYSTYSEFKSKYSSLITGDNGQMSIADGNLVITNPGQDANYNFDMTFDVKIPVLTQEDVTPAIKVDYVISTNNAKFYMTVPTIYAFDGTKGNTANIRHTNDGYISGLNEASYAVSNTMNPKADKGGLSSITVRIGLRQPSKADYTAVNGATVTIESVKVSLIYKASKTMTADHINPCLTADGSYVQLVNDVAMDAADLTMGQGAILDLNGNTLTLSDGYDLNVASGAIIVDSSAEKTGKIACAAADQLTIANPDNPQLPIWVDDGYFFIEPQLVADTHILFAEKNATSFTMDFRPGMGYVNNGENVRQTYLAGNTDHGLTLDAQLSWVDMDGVDGQSEDTGLDDMFNGMYAKDTTCGRLTVTGTEKYQTISLALTINSATGVVWELPAYTYENEYITVHYQQSFDNDTGAAFVVEGTTLSKQYGIGGNQTSQITADGKLDLIGSTTFAMDSAIPVGEAKTMVMEFDLEATANFGLHMRTSGNTRRQFVSFGGFDYDKTSVKVALPGTAVRMRIELDLSSGAIAVYQDGTLVTEAAATMTYLDWAGSTLYLNNSASSGSILIDNMLIYSYENVTE